MATLKAISTRLKSVTNIQKITKSMKMVSAAKYSRAERELREARPHGDGTRVFFDKLDIKQLSDPVPQVKQLVIAISSDRGLCGAVHTQISKAIKAELGKEPPKNTQIVCVGDKSRSLLQGMYRANIVLVVNEVGRISPNFSDASKIALFISRYEFISGKIYYNKFKSVVSYSVNQVDLYSANAVVNSPNFTMYDSVETDVLDSFLEFSLASVLFNCLKENACSEQASRMTAMDNASKNAGEMINMLTLKFNRTRQAVITRELIEIISGASALK